MRKKHVASATVLFNNMVYFAMRDLNIIGRLNLSDGRVKYIMGPEGESPYSIDLYGGICATEKELVLCPYNAKYLWVYTYNEKQWTNYEIPWHGLGKQNNQFTGAVKKDNKIFMMGDHALDIYVFDLVSRTGKYILEEKVQLWGGSFACWEDKIAIGISYTNSYLLLDLNTYEQKIRRVSQISKIAGIQYDDDRLWFIPRNCEDANIVATDLSGNIVASYKINNCGEVAGGVKKQNFLFIYGIAMPTYIFDLKTKNICVSDDVIYATNGDYENYKIATSFGGELIIYHEQEKKKYEILIEDKVMNEYINLSRRYKGIDHVIMQEDNIIGLDYLIQMIHCRNYETSYKNAMGCMNYGTSSKILANIID